MQEMSQTVCRSDQEQFETKIRLTFLLDRHKKLEQEVPCHFNAKDHQGIHNVEIHVLEFIKTDAQKPESKSLRLKTEYSWIQCLHTQIGMNMIDSDYL